MRTVRFLSALGSACATQPLWGAKDQGLMTIRVASSCMCLFTEDASEIRQSYLLEMGHESKQDRPSLVESIKEAKGHALRVRVR